MWISRILATYRPMKSKYFYSSLTSLFLACRLNHNFLSTIMIYVEARPDILRRTLLKITSKVYTLKFTLILYEPNISISYLSKFVISNWVSFFLVNISFNFLAMFDFFFNFFISLLLFSYWVLFISKIILCYFPSAYIGMPLFLAVEFYLPIF